MRMKYSIELFKRNDNRDNEKSTKESNSQTEPSEHVPDIRHKALVYIISQMKVSERMNLAFLGNSEVRKILIHDKNKIVAGAVLKSPCITQSEIVKIAGSKTVDVDLLSEIAETRKWTRIYEVRLALVNNSRTPTYLSLKLINSLRYKDIKRISRNKDLPETIVNSSKQIKFAEFD